MAVRIRERAEPARRQAGRLASPGRGRAQRRQSAVSCAAHVAQARAVGTPAAAGARAAISGRQAGRAVYTAAREQHVAGASHAAATAQKTRSRSARAEHTQRQLIPSLPPSLPPAAATAAQLHTAAAPADAGVAALRHIGEVGGRF
ncbi:uncharacterized protein LOC124775888 [Schistocerca piceifrons]|uniref:uncharacterized protein LOC124775888 n=1 Tax=Schistocerca piceifrons TaxID=274613 RepID=UPI001F5EA60D|nr:uncharacterized protein LOC124775888 [Schistocerca piceifrons]